MTFPTPNWTVWPRWALTGLVPERLADRPARATDFPHQPEWRREFEETLPDLREEDIAGSGFAITGYAVHSNLGGMPLWRAFANGSGGVVCGCCSILSPTTQAWIIPGSRTTLSITSPEPNRTWPGRRELYLGQAQARRFTSRPRPRSILSGLARYSAAQLRQSGHAGGDDWRACKDRRPV